MSVDWDRYKRDCERPDVLSRWLLNRTLALVEAVLGQCALGEALAGILAGTPLPRPADHRGPPFTDMFVTHLDGDRVRELVALIEQAQVCERLPRLLEAVSATAFRAAWLEYAQWFASTGQARKVRGGSRV